MNILNWGDISFTTKNLDFNKVQVRPKMHLIVMILQSSIHIIKLVLYLSLLKVKI
jgi:hypothetical protein